jgi:signal transduction histidine kinase
MIDPANSHFNPIPPPVHIEQLIADRNGSLPLQNTSLPALTRDIEIDYTALSFVMPQRVHFRYKLEGHDKSWQDVGARRSAFYSNLAPGMYTFHVMASNNDGVWNEQGAELRFKIAAAWYQTVWFKLLCLFLIFLLCYIFYKIRITSYAASMKARFDERLEERTRLARDLHDTLLQTIQGSKLVADHALEYTGDPVQTQRALHRLSEWLGQATSEGRAVLESLRGSTTEVTDLLGAFRCAAEQCANNSAMKPALQVIGKPRDVHPIVANEVYRIGHEAIQNACAHSGGCHLRIELEYSQNFILRVRDDGHGIDLEMRRAGRPGHFGLIGMQERAAKIGAALSIQNPPRGGTEIILLVPGKIIFTKSAVERRFPRISRLLKQQG